MSQRQVPIQENLSCAVCDSGRLTPVIDLPGFPITGIYLDAPDPDTYPGIDQGLNICEECGHAQLRSTLDPTYVYGEEYTHRSSPSPLAIQSNDFFFDFMERTCGSGPFKRVVEIGCNDLYLLRKLAPRSDALLGIDPIWQGRDQPGEEKIRVFGSLLEDTNLTAISGGNPDLIVASHTFEHVRWPKQALQQLLEVAADGAWFAVEVPCFDSLLTTHRFDQVFHQHIHYFSLASFRRLIAELGCKYIGHTLDYNLWGGSLLIAFRKSAPADPVERNVAARPAAREVTRRFEYFRRQMRELMGIVESMDHPLYGYGAAQMVPTLAYHMESDLDFLNCIWDDNPERAGKMFPHLAARIRRPEPDTNLQDGSVLITALDSTRPILRRVIDLRPRYILRPLMLF